jgi:hypothetical protein
MSWSIPTRIEEDIISGRAQYRTFQTGSGGQSILPVPTNAYVVIFGYDFSPAGGGFQRQSLVSRNDNSQRITDAEIRFFETQQISFYTGQDYFPFIHHINITNTSAVRNFNPVAGDSDLYTVFHEIDNTPISRQVYITSSNDVTITHGLILTTPVATQGPIPVTNRTPELLTFGGSGQTMNAQTNFGPVATPNQFIQPSPKDFEAFALGLLPNGVTDQAWASPDAANGLRPASTLLNSFGAQFRDAAACNYFLNLHYALYSSTIPEQRG